MSSGADQIAEVAARSGDEHRPDTLSGYLHTWWQGVKFGELGSLPIILGLAVIVVIFGFLDDTFLTDRNFTNLLLQMAATATIAIGVVFVLLIGEIDLSVAYVSAVGGVVTALLLRPGDPGWPWWAAVGAGLLCTTAIGFAQGLVITKAGVPSFVVTLAGLLIWSGVVLILTTSVSSVGTVRIEDDVVIGFANDFLGKTVGWILAVVVVAAFALAQLNTVRTRRAGGLYGKPIALIVLQTIGLAVVTFVAVGYANHARLAFHAAPAAR